MTNATLTVGVLPIAHRPGRRFAIVAALLLVLGAAGAALFLVQGVDRQLQDIISTYDLRREARDLQLTLLEAEAARRGYLLTLEAPYLDDFQSAMTDVEAHAVRMSEIAATASDLEPATGAAIAGIAEASAEIAATLAPTPELARSDLGIVVDGETTGPMAQLRATLEALIAREDHDLAARNGAVESLRQMLVAAILLALAGTAVLAYMLFNRTQRQVSAMARDQHALRNQNAELEARVRERTLESEQARAHAERERGRVEALLQDTNHRIGNSLATVSSLLALQVMRAKSDEVKTALEAARSRVHAIASGHRRLRLGDDLETTRADEFLKAVLDDLRSTQVGGARIRFETEFIPIVIGSRDATTIGIVLGELVTNAVKHAFAGRTEGQLRVRLFHGPDDVVVLEVADNGIGQLESASESGLGSVIIRQLAKQFGGEPSYGAAEGGGLRVKVTLPSLGKDTQLATAAD